MNMYHDCKFKQKDFHKTDSLLRAIVNRTSEIKINGPWFTTWTLLGRIISGRLQFLAKEI
jgi:hypothetical protein